ncbi:amidohydrolase [Rhodothermus marinus SG0.5JP17-172]|jgi:hippurate hydrolase|uniref:M20 metallopeptidase family protein n=1 Tax=Rhodothermus marinus TaxID=29549 RepID=UPI000223DA55|nr:M20 family metallopeptidase [Rhodothermus marinus]AEN72490.1 amidohydrolase [Rhodothermus marinus SG0.5JP17-172]MBO2493024.1 amidohydrolase [Rhodothermus marinus]
MLREIQALSEEIFPEVVRLRRIIHANPELAFEEYETARLVVETLQPLGLEIQTGVARTGVVATLRGAESGPTVLLRADMDALPIQEENDFEFRSRNPGKMHACGHDAHTASLLGTAMILSRLRDRLRGQVRMVFQPSEEKLPGGAQAMIREGVLEASDGVPAPAVVFAQHVQPDLPVGTIGVRSGMYMASADELYITVRAEGGHAAAPHRLAADGVLVAAHIIVALQSVVSRNAPPDVPTVLSIGRVLAEGATNVLPPTVRMEGTFRAMDEEWRFQAHAHIRRVVEQTARAFGAEADVEIVVGYPALYNHEEPTALVREAAREYVGPERVVELEPWFASEDFAYFLQQRPGCFYRIGTGNPEKGIVHGLHTPRFTIDEEALRIAPGFMAYLTWRYLQSTA